MNTLIVIASYENPQYLVYFFNDKSPFWTTGENDVDVVLINNGSTSTEYFNTLKNYENRIMVDYKPNYGRELAAFSFAETKYDKYDRYMFLQHDIQFLKTPWLKPFREKFESSSKCGAVGFKVRAVRSNPEDAKHFPTGLSGHECDDLLHKLIGKDAKLDKFCAGSMLYTSRKVLDHLRQYGGIYHVKTPESTPGFNMTAEHHTMFTTERLFGSMIENLGYEILEASGILMNGYEDR